MKRGVIPCDGSQPNRREPTAAAIHGKDCNAVIAPVGDVNEIPAGSNDDFSAFVLAAKACRQRRRYLERREHTAIQIETIGGNRRIQLVDHVSKRFTRMEIHMAGSHSRATRLLRRLRSICLPQYQAGRGKLYPGLYRAPQ